MKLLCQCVFVCLLLSLFAFSAVGDIYRAVHMGGNWGTNKESENAPPFPPDYFGLLHSLNVDWVGISVAIHVDDSLDSKVERKYTGVDIPTFTDDFLRQLIQAFRQQGFQVYLTLAFEEQESAQAEHPVERWQLGDPNMPDIEPAILPEFWPWSLDHPDHQQFVAEFWDTYTQQAVHFAQIAEDEGVELYSLGTETEGLFRSRSGGNWPNDFGAQLQTMVSAVRSVYSGSLTYDMHYSVLTSWDYFQPGSEHLWEDLGLDIVGVSAYFPLVDTSPTTPLSVETLEMSWEGIFQNYLLPLYNQDPDRPVLLLEFGYVDSVSSPYEPGADVFEEKVFIDSDNNGLDDGEETQANIYQAFFNMMDQHSGVVHGAFLWNIMMASQEMYAETFAQLRGMNIRGRLAEDVVRTTYATNIEGKVVGDGSPIEGIIVFAEDPGEEGWKGFDTTDENGDYTIPNLDDEAVYHVGTCAKCDQSLANWQYWVDEYYNNQYDDSDAEELSAPITIDFELELGGAISGTVEVDNPPPGVQLGVRLISGNPCDPLTWEWGPYASTEPDGTYLIPGVPAGDYYLRVIRLVDEGIQDPENYIEKWWAASEVPGEPSAGVVACNEAQTLEVEAEITKENINFQLERGAIIEGMLYMYGSNGLLVPFTLYDDIGITVLSGDPCNGNFVTGAEVDSSNGTYAIAGVPPGSYYLGTWNEFSHVNAWWDKVYPDNDPSSNPNCQQAVPITIADAEDHKSGVDFALRMYFEPIMSGSGIVDFPDGSASILFPEGAIPDEVFVFMGIVDEGFIPSTEGFHLVGDVYAFEVFDAEGNSITEFNPPGLTLTFVYDPAGLDGLNEGSLMIQYYDELLSSWVSIPSIVDTVAHTVTAETDHFSLFGVFGIVVPEPTTCVLFGLGLLGILAFVRKRRNRRK